MNIAVYGGGGFAREVGWLVGQIPGLENSLVCFIDDDPQKQGKLLNNVPIISLQEAADQYPDAKVVGGIGTPSSRENVIQKAGQAGFDFIQLIHPNVQVSDWVEIGPGAVICAGNILTVNIQLGRHVQINLDCTIGHDVIMDDFATLAPGVHVSGYVEIGKRVHIGTGANIINGTGEKPLIIGDDAVIGAGACVIRDVPTGDVVAGVPAKSIKKE